MPAAAAPPGAWRWRSQAAAGLAIFHPLVAWPYILEELAQTRDIRIMRPPPLPPFATVPGRGCCRARSGPFWLRESWVRDQYPTVSMSSASLDSAPSCCPWCACRIPGEL